MENNVVKNNWGMITYIGGILFACGVIYGTFSTMQKEIAIINQRLDKKIKIINAQEKRIIELEKVHVYIKGKEDGASN